MRDGGGRVKRRGRRRISRGSSKRRHESHQTVKHGNTSAAKNIVKPESKIKYLNLNVQFLHEEQKAYKILL